MIQWISEDALKPKDTHCRGGEFLPYLYKTKGDSKESFGRNIFLCEFGVF